jgi:hypothetical protein
MFDIFNVSFCNVFSTPRISLFASGRTTGTVFDSDEGLTQNYFNL